MKIKNSLVRLWNFFKISSVEVIENFSFYFIYLVIFIIVSNVQIFLNIQQSFNRVELIYFSRFLFLLVPILVLSKILYIIKIRNTGIGEYGRVLFQFLKYNFYYFSLVFICVGLIAFPGVLLMNTKYHQVGIGMITVSALIFLYLILFYSLAPYSAVFNDAEDVKHFANSKILIKRNIPLVVFERCFSLALPIFFSIPIDLKNATLNVALNSALSIPSAFLTIVTTLTTAKVYFYLNELE